MENEETAAERETREAAERETREAAEREAQEIAERNAELTALRAEKEAWTAEREALEAKAKRVVTAPKTKAEKGEETVPLAKPKSKSHVSRRWFGEVTTGEGVE